MARGLWRRPLRVAAVITGVVVPLLASGLVHADLPGGIPAPPGLPQSGQPIPMVIEPPTLFALSIPPSPNGCDTALSYDNSQATPPGTLFRGETACGPGVVNASISVHAVLTDVLGNVVASASSAGGVGNGPVTSQGDWVVTAGSSLAQPGLNSNGPVPGMEYTIQYTSSVTLAWPQYWGAPAAGCSISGQTMVCNAATTYSFIPGTAGGFVFS